MLGYVVDERSEFSTIRTGRKMKGLGDLQPLLEIAPTPLIYG